MSPQLPGVPRSTRELDANARRAAPPLKRNRFVNDMMPSEMNFGMVSYIALLPFYTFVFINEILQQKKSLYFIHKSIWGLVNEILHQ